MAVFTMGGGSKPEQSKTVTPTAAGFTVTPDAGKVLSGVTVNGDADLIENNIAEDANVFGVAGKHGAFLAGTNIIVSADTERTHSSTTYTKVKEIQIKKPGIYRVYFDLRGAVDQVYYAYGRIYKNGVAVGTLRQTVSYSYVTFSEDITFAANDYCQLYISAQWGIPIATRNFRIGISINYLANIPLVVTN